MSLEEEEEKLREHWEHMRDAQLDEEEEVLDYSLFDDEYGEDWDEELWVEEEEIEEKKPKRKE
jgi:hypothetical protein